MRHLIATSTATSPRAARLAALAIVVTLAVAACSGSATPASSVPSSAVAPAVASTAPSAAAPAAAGNAVSIANFSFSPAAITVSIGATITWTNNDSSSHTVTADDGSFDSGRLAPGATFSQTFATAGTFAYHCSIHSMMKGTVTVR
jgi:plastocyanin